MPIAVEVVSQDKFDSWVAAKKAEAGIETTVEATEETNKEM
jgi:heme/copper-type cytochrome/quinol oxidase subunit 2